MTVQDQSTLKTPTHYRCMGCEAIMPAGQPCPRCTDPRVFFDTAFELGEIAVSIVDGVVKEC